MLLLAAIISLAGVSWLSRDRPAGAQGETAMGIDANPSANTATSLGEIQSCVAAAPGEGFAVDIYVKEVTELLAWEVYVEYDAQLVEVADRDVDQFLGANAGSNVYDVSERLPDSDGLYRVAAADTSDPPTPDSGSGVLARLTLRARAPGTGVLGIAFRDLNDDGTPDLGPFFRNVSGEPIDDTNGDTFFDGPSQNARVTVGGECPSSPDGAAAEEGSGGARTMIWVIAGASAAIVVAGLTGLTLRRLARRQMRA